MSCHCRSLTQMMSPGGNTNIKVNKWILSYRLISKAPLNYSKMYTGKYTPHKMWLNPGKLETPFKFQRPNLKQQVTLKQERKVNSSINIWKAKNFAICLSPSTISYLVDLRLGGGLGLETNENISMTGKLITIFFSSNFSTLLNSTQSNFIQVMFQTLGNFVFRNACPK